MAFDVILRKCQTPEVEEGWSDEACRYRLWDVDFEVSDGTLQNQLTKLLEVNGLGDSLVQAICLCLCNLCCALHECMKSPPGHGQ